MSKYNNYVYIDTIDMKFKLSLKKKCLEQNRLLSKKKLIIHNFGNVSLRLDKNYFIIKPSGIDLKTVKASEFPVVSIKTNKVVEGKLKPSSDTPTHLEIYKKYPKLKSITHTHSPYAITWAQSGKAIPLIGTTHADYWSDEVPIAGFLSLKELNKGYEKNTGNLILRTLKKKKLNPYQCPGILVSGHGPFTWGTEIDSSVINAEILEFIAKTTFNSFLIKIKKKLPKYISKKHFKRKHGNNSYYGQN